MAVNAVAAPSLPDSPFGSLSARRVAVLVAGAAVMVVSIVLLAPAVADWTAARTPLRGRALRVVVVALLTAGSALYEMIEWLAAEAFGGELGAAYLGTQGDQWDAQKDMALALAGSLLWVLLPRQLSRA